MTDNNLDYVSSRIEMALEEANGNSAKAQRLLLSWVNTDNKLLIGLATPHLKSLIGYALQQVIFEDIDEDIINTPPATPESGVEGENPNIGKFGMEILQNITGDKTAQNFGFVTDDMDAPKKTSQRHIDSILKLAKKKE